MSAIARGGEEVVLVAYPAMTALDLLGPHHMLAGLTGARVRIAARSRDPVISDLGLTIVPDLAFDECPRTPDLLLVPGGTYGTLGALRDRAFMARLTELGRASRHVASVCTGSLLLGAAGLLRGRRATSHWLTRDLLAEFDAIPVAERVVWDGQCITGAGVTAGMDLALAVVQRWRGEEAARIVALASEYDPEPPVIAGNPEQAGPATSGAFASALAPWLAELRRELEAIRTEVR